jgi:RND family efflux transporter MFP subunit
MRIVRLIVLPSLLVWTGVTTGCQPGRMPPPAPAKPVVPVSHPIRREVTDFVEYTGRTDAVESVGIRARVTGYLVRMPFKEGAEVKKGDLLFEIDPRPYQAQFDQAESQVRVIEAQLKLAQVTYERARSLVERNAASQQEVDQNKAAVDEAVARVNAAKASLEVYRLNLSFTKVTSPIDGQVSRYYYTLGNLINQDQTLLTTVVSVDPMFAYFDMDERTVLRIRTAINQGRIKMRSDAHEIPVLMSLEGEEGYPHHGVVNFVNNVVNPSTGTVAVRGVFKNPKPPIGRRLFSPGMFVRIRLPIGEPHPAVLVVDRALGSDQGLKYVYIIDADRKVQYRRVKTGPLQDDGLRVIEEGVKPDDWVVVGGLQSLRPRTEVDTEQVPMPVPGAPIQK